jgi:hypothetical protein
MLLSLYTAALANLCPLLTGIVTDCSLIYPQVAKNQTSNALWQGWGSNLPSLTALQHATCLLWVIHLVVISVGFVHRESPIWRESPFRNRLWSLAVLLVYAKNQLLFLFVILKNVHFSELFFSLHFQQWRWDHVLPTKMKVCLLAWRTFRGQFTLWQLFLHLSDF